MALATYELQNWAPVPVRLPRTSELSKTGGTAGSGHPSAAVFIVTCDVPKVGLQLFDNYAEGNPDGPTSISVTLSENSAFKDGKHYYHVGNGNEIILEDGFWQNEIGVHVYGPVGTPVDISLQVSTSDTVLTVDDPPTGGPDGIFPPVNLTATQVDDHVDLLWVDQADNELGFELEWSTVPAVTWEKFATTPANITVYSDYDIVPGDIYSYRVRAFKADKASIYSNIATTEGQPLVLSPTQGPTAGKTSFTITGAFNPAATNTVKFGTKSATDLVVTVNDIKGRTPAHDKGIVDVTVTRAGVATVLEDAYEYTAGRLYPRLEVSANQNFPAPLPSSVTLSAQVVDDPDGVFDDATFRWELVSAPTQEAGQGILISDTTSKTPTVTASTTAQGRYLFRVTATAKDVTGNNVSISNVAQATVEASGVPQVQPFSTSTRYPNPVTLDPTVTDDGWNGPLTFAWAQISGPDTATIVSVNSKVTEVRFPNMQGTWSFRLTVANNRFSGSGIVKVTNLSTVSQAQPPPFGEMTVTIGGTEY